MFQLLIVFLISYIVGSINPAIFISKRVLGLDIREMGSGNAGTTNTLRVMGPLWATMVFILDLLKVVIAFGLMYFLNLFMKYDIVMLKQAFAIGVVIGHCYPIYYGFKGGKGVATLIMAMLLIDYKIALVCILAGLVTLAITRMMSLASIVGCLLLPIVMVVMNTKFFIMSLFLSAFVIFKHSENIKRILNKEEHKLFSKE